MQLSPRSQLSLFAEVVRQGGIAAGGRVLGLTASATEDNLKALEARLGHILIDMDGSSIRLTPAGERTYEALDLLGEAIAAQPPATPVAPVAAPAIRLTLGANPPIFSNLREKLAAFEDAHEDVGIDLDLDCFTGAAARRKIAAGMVDLAYYYSLPGDEEDAPASAYAWTERLSLFIGAGHELAGSELVSRDDLALTPPLLLTPRNPLRPLIGTLMDLAGIGAAPPACESDDHSLLLERVRAGDGFIALFGPLAQQFGAMEGVRKLAFGAMLPAIDVRRAMAPGDNGAAQILAASLD